MTIFASPASPCRSFCRPLATVVREFDAGLLPPPDQPGTPHLDGMATAGWKRTNFYAPANLRTPARRSLMTGSYPLRGGFGENEKGGSILVPGNRKGLQPD